MIPQEPDWADIIGRTMARHRWTLPMLVRETGLKYHAVHALATGRHTHPKWTTGAKIWNAYTRG